MRRTALAGTMIAALLIFGLTVVGRAGANGIGSASFQATTTATGTGPDVTETALVTSTVLQTTTADAGATTGTTATAGATDTGTTATAGTTDTGTTATAAATTGTDVTAVATTDVPTTVATTAVTPGQLPSTGAGDNGLITLLSLVALLALGLAAATLLIGRRSAQR